MKKRILVITAIPAIVLLLVLLLGGIYSAKASDAGLNISDGVLSAYTGNESSVSIPPGVRTIGSEAFCGNSTLESVTIPEGVTTIGYAAFKDCSSLKTVKIPDSVTKIEDSAFWGCSSLSYVSIGKGLYDLGSGTFSDCDSLMNIALDKGNINFVCADSGIFSADRSVMYQYFAGSRNMTYTIPSTVSEIKRYSFWGCDNLKELIVSGMPEIGDYAIASCDSLENLVFQTPTTKLSMGAAKDCKNLKQVTIPLSLSNIHDTAFEGCPETLYFNCPDMSSASAYATEKGYVCGDFNTYDSSQLVSVPADNKSSDDSGMLLTSDADGQDDDGSEVLAEENDSDDSDSGLYTYTEDDVDGELLGSCEIVSDRAYVIMSSDMEVSDGSKLPAVDPNETGDYSHYLDQTLTSYTIPSGITTIGAFAFARTRLTEISIPDGVTEIGKGAFYHCDSLGNVSVPNSVKKVGEKAFAYTPWYQAWENDPNAGDFLVIGDGVLIGYKGNEESPELPDDVKVVADGVLAAN
ncbi:MAG: leucine-rich repeat domain-containing protein [Lachnospiraceae bacterium]|nr:leucine-rich repeat domain-containing protein [Lachnospiraceae bacterium]